MSDEDPCFQLCDLWMKDEDEATLGEILQGTASLLPRILAKGCSNDYNSLRARITLWPCSPRKDSNDGGNEKSNVQEFWDQDLKAAGDAIGVAHSWSMEFSAAIVSPDSRDPLGQIALFVNSSQRSMNTLEEQPTTRCLDRLAKRLGRVLKRRSDIQEHIKTITALEATDRRHRESQKIAKLGQWELDIPTGSLVWSDEIYNLFRVDKNKFGASYEAFLNAIHPDDRAFVDKSYTDSLKTKTPYNILHRLLFDDGEVRWVREMCRTEYDPQTGRPLYSVGVVQDITDLKQTQEMDRLKSAFLANMSHEIRTPLSKSLLCCGSCLPPSTPDAVLGYTELILMETNTEGLSDRNREYLQIIRNSGELLVAVVSDVLDFSTIEAGQLKLDQKPFSLRNILELVRATADGFKSSLGCNDDGLKVDFRCTYCANQSCDESCGKASNIEDRPIQDRLIGDSTRFQQVLSNLLHNAIKFTKDRPGGCVEYSYSLPRSDSTEQMLQFYVKDNGDGIPVDKHQSIFEAFQQAHPSCDSHELGGMGLGLTISKRLVELMGGTMWLESSARDPGRGTTMYFTMPYLPDKITKAPGGNIRFAACKKRAWSSVSTSSLTPTASVSSVGTLSTTELGSVLIVDDNRVNLKLAVRIVNVLGYKTTTATNGEEAVAAFETDKSIRLILMDKEMPAMDGLEAVQRIRRIEGDEKRVIGTPVVALTAAAYKEDREPCLAAGCDGYLTKPIKRETLREVLFDYIGQPPASS